MLGLLLFFYLHVLSCSSDSSLTYIMCCSEQGNNHWSFTGKQKHCSSAEEERFPLGGETEEQGVLSTQCWDKLSLGLGHGGSPREIGLDQQQCIPAADRSRLGKKWRLSLLKKSVSH